MNLAMLYLGAALAALWGIIHLVSTGSIVNRFGDISADNERILTMSWMADGIALVTIGVLVGVVAYIDTASSVAGAVFLVSAVGLLVLALVSFSTGFKVNELPFKLCSVIRVVSALLILAGGFL